MGSSNSGVAGSSGGSMHASFHPSIANLAALPGPLFISLSQVLRGCPPPPAISTALAAHLSRNNTRSNYITLSGKGAVALPASNLFSLFPSALSTRLFQTFGLKVRNRIRVRKHWGSGAAAKNERGASLPKWRVFTSTLFSLPF